MRHQGVRWSWACGLALVLSLSCLTSCSLNPQASGTALADAEEASQPKKVAAPGEFELIGKVPVDEFNDQATGKDVPSRGGQVVVAFNSEPNNLNPLTDNSAVNSYILSYVYNSLLRRDPETYEWEGSLAERWVEEDIVVRADGSKLRGKVTNPDSTSGPVVLNTASGTVSIPRQDAKEVRRGVVFTFFLRRNVKFHDGKPLTASDVKFSYDTIKNEYVDAPSLRNYYNDLESCEVLDDYTVRLTYSKQYWQAREFAGGFPVMPRHVYDPDGLIEKDPEAFGKRFNESDHNRSPVGSGQYKFERWDTGLQVVLARNDDYFDVPRRGLLDRIVVKFISDPVASLQALKNGDVNFLPGVTAEQYEKEMGDTEFLKKFVKAEYYTGSFSYIGWNMRHPPFDDPKVRVAMEYGAIDRQQFLDQVLYGRGVTVTGFEYYFGPAYDHSLLPRPFDPEKAKQLLLEAGWYDRDGDGLRDKNGQPFRFELLMPSGSTTNERLAAIMKENLRKLGIDMTVRELEWATFLENINDHRFDACRLGWAIGVEDDPYQIWHTSQSENRGSNHVGFGNAETDRLIEESRTTIDDAKRRAIFFQLHRIVYDTQPYLFFYTGPNLGAYDKRYRGVKLYKVRPGYDLAEWYLPKQ